MNSGQIQLAVIIAYLVALLMLGIGASRFFRGTKADYLLASHSIGPFLLLMSLFGTTMTAFALVGSTGEAFKEGIGVYGQLASASGIVHSLCFFLVGIKLWSFGKRYGYATQIEFFRDRLNSEFLGLLLFPILVGLVVPYLLIGVMSSGTVIQNLTAGAFVDVGLFQTDSPATNGGIPPWLGSLGICVVVLIYVFLGGMRGTAWANTLQTIVFMTLGVVTFVVIAMKLGGEPTLLASMQELSSTADPDRLSRREMSRTLFLTYLLVPLSVAMFPHVFQHWLTARNAKAFKLPVVMQPIFIMIVWVPCVLIGVWATSSLVPETPPLPRGNPNAILPFLVSTQTGPLLGGFLAAGILAAIMSSLDSQFLCLGTIFSNDIVGRYFTRGKLDERQSVWNARLFIVVIVAATYALSLAGSRSVFAMGVWCFSGYAGLFPLVVAALYWRRFSLGGAIASIVVAMGLWGFFFLDSRMGADSSYSIDFVQVDPESREAYQARMGELRDLTRDELVERRLALETPETLAVAESRTANMASHRIRGEILDREFFDQYRRHETMPVLWICLASAVALLLVTWVTPPPPPETVDRFFPRNS